MKEHSSRAASPIFSLPRSASSCFSHIEKRWTRWSSPACPLDLDVSSKSSVRKRQLRQSIPRRAPPAPLLPRHPSPRRVHQQPKQPRHRPQRPRNPVSSPRDHCVLVHAEPERGEAGTSCSVLSDPDAVFIYPIRSLELLRTLARHRWVFFRRPARDGRTHLQAFVGQDVVVDEGRDCWAIFRVSEHLLAFSALRPPRLAPAPPLPALSRRLRAHAVD